MRTGAATDHEALQSVATRYCDLQQRTMMVHSRHAPCERCCAHVRLILSLFNEDGWRLADPAVVAAIWVLGEDFWVMGAVEQAKQTVRAWLAAGEEGRDGNAN